MNTNEKIRERELRARCLQSDITREVGVLEGLGYALPEYVRPAFFDVLEALSGNLDEVFESI